jgi:hypothetical protein
MTWEQVLTIFAIVATNVGTIIALYVHSDNKMDANRKETNEILRGIQLEIRGIQAEMKDFHGRLCAIEERKKA